MILNYLQPKWRAIVILRKYVQGTDQILTSPVRRLNSLKWTTDCNLEWIRNNGEFTSITRHSSLIYIELLNILDSYFSKLKLKINLSELATTVDTEATFASIEIVDDSAIHK